MGLEFLFKWVLSVSLIACLLTGLIFLLKFLFKTKLNARWQYCIWFLLLLRLLIPVIPSTSFSIFNLYPITARNINLSPNLTLYDFGTKLNQFTEPANFEAPIIPKAQAIENTSGAAASTRTPLWLTVQFYYYLWLAGVILLGLGALFLNLKFRFNLKKYSQPAVPLLQELVHDCRLVMGIKREVLVIQTGVVKSPGLYGFLQPRILIPPGIEHFLAEKGLRCIFLHELAHLKRKDIAVNWVIGFLQILHWFNPILQYAFRKIRQDQEMACDALALSCIAQEERIAYGLTIIDLLQVNSQAPRLPALAGVLDNRAQITRRVKAIAVSGKNPYQRSFLALLVIIITGCLVLTGATAGNGFNSSAAEGINHPFVNDPKIIGKWQGVDYVDRIDQFKPGKRFFKSEKIPLATYYFSSGGRVPLIPDIIWTKGLIIDRGDNVIYKYQYREIKGETYFFLELNDETNNMPGSYKPRFHVFRKENDHDYQETEIPRKTDPIDYPFVNDPEVIGTWRSVDFVYEMSQFTPDHKFCTEEVYLKDLVFYPDGLTPDSEISWTQGIVIDRDRKTASHYQITNIHGSTYMFFEWKTEDYIFREMKPCYYVLKKVD